MRLRQPIAVRVDDARAVRVMIGLVLQDVRERLDGALPGIDLDDPSEEVAGRDSERALLRVAAGADQPRHVRAVDDDVVGARRVVAGGLVGDRGETRDDALLHAVVDERERPGVAEARRAALFSPGKHGAVPPLPASEIQRSPCEPNAMPRGLSSPLATVTQPLPVPECACAAGTATSAATTATASSLRTCIRSSYVRWCGRRPPPSGEWFPEPPDVDGRLPAGHPRRLGFSFL